jgi:hypothetical protein
MQEITMNSPSPEENSAPEMSLDEKVDRMLEAARGGLTPHELLIQASLAEAANADERAAAKEKNRERALKLLELLEKSQG